jgi:hypothetical protein
MPLRSVFDFMKSRKRAEQTAPFQSGHPKRSERRAWVRFLSDQEVCCQPIANLTAAEMEFGWLGRVRDVSRGGIALILSRRFEPGTILTIELSIKAKGRQLVRVVHATLETKGRWIIGCAFASILSEEELQTFLRE